VLTRNGDIVSGSARSVAGYNLYEAVHACREYLLAYGGHCAAAGLSMLPANVEAFTNKFEEAVASTIPEHLLIPEITIDSTISFDTINDSFYRILCQMEPFGPGNLRPVFMATNVMNNGYSKLVKEQHIRFVITQGSRTLTGIGFNMADRFPLLEMKKPLDILFTIDENEWNGTSSLQLKVMDLKLA
jgi:single-stranded-DNA-specific exonuclease